MPISNKTPLLSTRSSPTTDPETLPYSLPQAHRYIPHIAHLSSNHTINVGADELATQRNEAGIGQYGFPVSNSLRHVQREACYLLHHSQKKQLVKVESLFVVGEFRILADGEERDREREEEEVDEPWSEIVKAEEEDERGEGSGDQGQRLTEADEDTESDYVEVTRESIHEDEDLKVQEMHVVTREEEHWELAVLKIGDVIKEMNNLKAVTWISGLSFLPRLWTILPHTLTNLCIDVGKPVRLDAADFRRPVYISQSEMKPLTRFTKLKELRISGMMESYQTIIWETVWRNESETGYMEVVELEMGYEPITYPKHWRKAEDVRSFRDAEAGETSPYLGDEGKGFLDERLGCAEYLDLHCMRKAAISAGIKEIRHLPLKKLKLEGFVVDSLPFQDELSHLILLRCGSKCTDAGMVAPKRGDEDAYSIIVWPNWSGHFGKIDTGEGAEEYVVLPQQSRSQIASEPFGDMCTPVEDGEWLEVTEVPEIV